MFLQALRPLACRVRVRPSLPFVRAVQLHSPPQCSDATPDIQHLSRMVHGRSYTPEEDSILMRERTKGTKWKGISLLTGRSIASLMARAKVLRDITGSPTPTLRAEWPEGDDAILTTAFSLFGKDRDMVMTYCRARFSVVRTRTEYLARLVHLGLTVSTSHRFTTVEDLTLLLGIANYGDDWDKIATMLGTLRTPTHCITRALYLRNQKTSSILESLPPSSYTHILCLLRDSFASSHAIEDLPWDDAIANSPFSRNDIIRIWITHLTLLLKSTPLSTEHPSPMSSQTALSQAIRDYAIAGEVNPPSIPMSPPKKKSSGKALPAHREYTPPSSIDPWAQRPSPSDSNYQGAIHALGIPYPRS